MDKKNISTQLKKDVEKKVNVTYITLNNKNKEKNDNEQKEVQKKWQQ